MLTFLFAVPAPTAKDQADAIRSQNKRLRVTLKPIDGQMGLYVGGVIPEALKTSLRAGQFRRRSSRAA